MTAKLTPWIVIHDGTAGSPGMSPECRRCGRVLRVCLPMESRRVARHVLRFCQDPQTLRRTAGRTGGDDGNTSMTATGSSSLSPHTVPVRHRPLPGRGKEPEAVLALCALA